MNKRIYLCLAHMSGNEQKYIDDAFRSNWVVPLGPNVDGFEADLHHFSVQVKMNSISNIPLIQRSSKTSHESRLHPYISLNYIPFLITTITPVTGVFLSK